MKEHVNYEDIFKRFNEQLPKGVFLNTSFEGEYNTMTIGWGLVGITWSKPVVCVAVRFSRHTYSLLEKSNKFTISIPETGTLKKELGICGTKSGRDIDKFETCSFKKDKIIDKCDLHIECEVVQKTAMDKTALESSIKERFYGTDDYHMFYFGEIKDCYYTKEEK